LWSFARAGSAGGMLSLVPRPFLRSNAESHAASASLSGVRNDDFLGGARPRGRKGLEAGWRRSRTCCFADLTSAFEFVRDLLVRDLETDGNAAEESAGPDRHQGYHPPGVRSTARRWWTPVDELRWSTSRSPRSMGGSMDRHFLSGTSSRSRRSTSSSSWHILRSGRFCTP
jgi:hypothetical protein